jgi:hypothetical protein
LPNPSLILLGKRNAWRRFRAGLLVLFDPQDEQATGSVGKRSHIFGRIILVFL